MSCPKLFFLAGETDSAGSEQLLNGLGLMAGYANCVGIGGDCARGFDNVLHQREAACAMQHLGVLRAHPGAESRGQHHH